MTTPRLTFLLSSLFMVYTQGLWERLLNSSPAVILVVELSIWTYLLLSLNYFIKKSPGILIFALFLLISLFVAIVNGDSILSWLKYIRYFVYFYLIFVSIWQTNITIEQWKIIFKFVIFLILLQGIGSAYNVFILAERVEGHVGFMSSLGGTTAATFPLFIISISVLMFFLYNGQRRFGLILLACIISAILVGYASEKRAVFYTIPLFILITILISYFYLSNRAVFFKRLTTILIFIVLFSPLYFLGIRSTSGVNYYLSGKESNLQLIANAISYARNYEENVSNKGLTTGRAGSTSQIIINSLKEHNLFFFGQGYGSVKDENSISKLGVNYGIVGFTRDIISAGWIVMFLALFIFLKAINSNFSIRTEVTDIVRILMILIFLFTHLTYSSDFTVHLKINYMLALICAFINSPMHFENLLAVLELHFEYSDGNEQ